MEDFVYEANLELDKLARASHTTECDGPDRVIDGGRIFIEDLVHVVNRNHDYNEWIVMVNGITPCSTLRCSLGIPPGRDRKTTENDK